jgi:hypothetical protein
MKPIKSKGQALTEFALILPLLLLLLLGIIEGARIIWAYITVQNAAREATRYGVTGQPFDENGNPWTFSAARKTGCNPQVVDGQLKFYPPEHRQEENDPPDGYCNGPNDRVDAIIGVALERGSGLGVDRPAISPGVYTATGYVDTGGTYGVRVFGQETGTDTRVDYAGREGLNVLVQVYYNVRLLDPLYAAIIPQGFVSLRGEVQMQNEGIDSALGAVPPGGITPPEIPEGSTYVPGTTNPPVVISLSGDTVTAGDSLDVKLEYHIENTLYDVYLYSASLGYVKICSNLETNNFGSVSLATCPVPPATTPGPYQLVSIAAGVAADPANHFGLGDLVDVLFASEPLITIENGNLWPPGSTIRFNLFGHQPCPADWPHCPGSRQPYDIALIGGIFSSPGQVLASGVQVDEFGNSTGPISWQIPSGLDSGNYTVVTYKRDTTDPVIASTGLEIVQPEIIVQGSGPYPAASGINVHLRGHAPNRTYTLRWIDGRTGATVDFGPVTTDQFGNTVASVRFTIPANTPDSPPRHRIISLEAGGGGFTVASTEVEVFTPPTPFIVVVGGTDWPAGSLIEIELHKHYNGPYNLYFGTRLIESVSATLIADGFYRTTFVIPVTTPNGTYTIRSERVSNGATEATTDIQVRIVPLIQVAEGSVVLPGSDITVQLLQHQPNESYAVYLDGNFLFNVPTDGSGRGQRVYDLTNLPDLEGGPFTLESRRGDQVVASTQIYIMAADLQITNIQFPPGPPVNVMVPVTVTVRNASPVAVTGEHFDVDLYMNPAHPPTTSSQFPPGDYKRWISNVPPTGTTQLVFSMTLSGVDYTVYGRVDTSNYVVETNETNNIYQTAIQAACALELKDEFDSSNGNWTGVAYGDAGNPPSNFSVSGGRMRLLSDGSTSFGTSDSTYFVYYNQPVTGNFDARVRLVDGPVARNWAKAGLEVRADVGAANSSKVYIAGAKSDHNGGWAPAVQSAYRDGAGTGTDRPADAGLDAAVTYPIWLRVVRNGDEFRFYFSDADATTPPADSAWIPHGSVTMANMPAMVNIGLFNVSYDSGNGTDRSSFDSFRVCVKDDGTGGGEEFPPGLQVCSGNVLQNSGFENASLAPWSVPGGGVNRNDQQYEGVFAALMHTYAGKHLNPSLGQTFQMPEWIISSTTTINLSLYRCVRDGLAGSGAEPLDELLAGLRSTGITPTLVTTPTKVADGNTSIFGPTCEGSYTPFAVDLASLIQANPEDYAEQTLQLYLYAPGNNQAVCNAAGGGVSNPSCYETDFFLDNVEVEVCTTQPIPPHEPGKATLGGPLRVFLGGAPQPKQGVRVWTYQQNGQLLTTYSLHDSNYFFYNVDPGEYVIYSEYWDGPNLYSAFTTVTVGPDQTRTNLSLLLR